MRSQSESVADWRVSLATTSQFLINYRRCSRLHSLPSEWRLPTHLRYASKNLILSCFNIKKKIIRWSSIKSIYIPLKMVYSCLHVLHVWLLLESLSFKILYVLLKCDFIYEITVYNCTSTISLSLPQPGQPTVTVLVFHIWHLVEVKTNLLSPSSSSSSHPPSPSHPTLCCSASIHRYTKTCTSTV